MPLNFAELQTFIWNPEKQRFFGRNGKGWGEICAFFAIFYFVLLSYFFGMVCFFNVFIDPLAPTLQGETSFVKNPGLSYRPLDPDGQTIEFNYKDANTYKKYVQSLNDAMKIYEDAFKTAWASFYKNCTDDDPANEFACRLTSTTYYDLRKCTSKDGYGFPDMAPCVMLRLNKVYGWEPKKYLGSDLDISPLPASAITLAKEGLIKRTGYFIWVWCRGKTPADQSILGTNFQYFPNQGFPYFAYPYLNQQGYLQPFVMVQIGQARLNTRVTVACEAYAPNLKVNTIAREAYTEFNLLIKG